MISPSKAAILLTGVLSLFVCVPTFSEEMQEQYAIPPSHFPGGDDDLPFFISASYIYWQPYQTGMVLATSRDNVNIQGSVLQPKTEAASGFKVGLQHNLEHDGWIASGSYTWFYHNPLESALNLKEGTNYVPVFSNSIDAFLTLKSKFRTLFQRIDVQFARPQYVGHYLSLSSLAGVMGAWDFQRLFYHGDASTNNIISQQARFTQAWWGIGPRAGGQGVFYLNNTWGFYFTSGVGLLLASHDTKMDIKNATNTTTENKVLDIRTTIYDVEPMIEGGIGLCWEKDNCTWFAMVRLGWEIQTYFGHNSFTSGINYSATGTKGNFSLQGLTLKAELNL